MSRIKQFSGLMAAFIGGLAVASMILNNTSSQTSTFMPTKAPLGQKSSTMPVMLDNSIQLPHSASLPNASPKTVANKQVMAENIGTNMMESKSPAGKSIARPKAGEKLQPLPQPEMIELPLESEVDGDAPEPEELENTANMTVPEELPKPGIIENAPVPKLQTNK